MTIAAYTTAFSVLVLTNDHPSIVVNIILNVPKDTAFTLSKSGVDAAKLAL